MGGPEKPTVQRPASSDGVVVATISPAPSPTDPPVFEILRYGAPRGVTTCQHSNYQLDMTSRRVLCSECRDILDPFQVLVAYGEWEEKIRNRKVQCERVEKQMLITEARQLAKRRCWSDTERVTMTAWLQKHSWGAGTVKEVRETVSEWRDRADGIRR